MTERTDLTLTAERVIDAPPKRLLDAWLDPAMLARFMMPAAGVTVPKAATDPRVGGRFDIVMRTPEREIPHWGIYREIVPHSRLVFTWQSEFSVEDSTVTLTFAPAAGGTRVVLTHARFADAQMRDNHMAGWTAILAALETAA